MEKDLSFLRANKVFSWLCSCLPIVLIGIMQYFFFTAYTAWIFWEIVLLAVLSGVSAIAFSVWLGISVLPKPTVKNVVVFSVIFTTLYCFFYFGAAAIDLAIKNNNLSAAVLGMGTSDFILALSFVFGWVAPEKKSLKQAAMACGALLCALIVVLSVFVGFMENKKTSFTAVSEFSVLDSLPDGGGKKVKVILLNGQSNASGVSRVPYLSQEEKARYAHNFDNVYINYFCDNGFNSSHGAFVRVGLNQGYMTGFFGPELGIGETLNTVENENFIILKYTWGGTILDTQWFAPREDGSVGPLYTAFINFTKTYMDYLRSRNYDAEIGAMCWMQGESDSVNEDWTVNYYDNTVKFVASLRSDLAAYAAADGIYYIDAGISDSKYWERYERVNDAKKNYASVPAHKAVYIDTIAAGLDYSTQPIKEEGGPDLAHYDASSEITLGHLFAERILERYGIVH